MQMRKCSYFALILFFTYSYSAHSQKKQRHHKVVNADLMQKDTVPRSQSEFQLDFKNINNVAFYYDASLLSQIKSAENNSDYPTLILLLENYIQNFGIQNFSRNTDMIWKLGDLYLQAKAYDKANFMYRLALKHIRGKGITKIKRYYDSTANVRSNDFVPLDYYYELVEFRKHIDTLTPPQSVYLNMGDLVNDLRYPDYGPTLNVQGNMLIYTKRKKIANETKLSYRENEELYFTINYDGFWDEGLPFTNVINSNCNEGSAIISRDGKTLYFSRCITPEFKFDCQDCLGACDIYVSYLQEDGKWSMAQNLGRNVNTNSWESHPTLSHSEDTLYFASDRIGGFGLSDIWYTYKLPKGGWANAQNLGPVINTRGNEVSPFYHPNHHVLYFSSNDQLLNFGDRDSLNVCHTYDIYKTRLLQKKWQEPNNIGPLVNGKGDEYYFTIDSKGKDLFYSKSELDNLANLDLFSFPLPMEAQATSYTKFKGTLKDSLTDETFKGIVSVIDLSNGIEVAPKYMREDGSFEFDLNNNNEYLLIIQGDDFLRIEERFFLKTDTTITLKTQSLKISKWEFKSLEFENNSAEINESMQEDLDKVVDFLVMHPELNLVISGHTDGSGDPIANKRLSQNRANSIKEYIVSKGQLESNRIEAIGYGSAKPIVVENTEEDKKINRRVEFELKKKQTNTNTNTNENEN
jgi:outer membrane protein OmpA-like peptidoglycan-associated protein